MHHRRITSRTAPVVLIAAVLSATLLVLGAGICPAAPLSAEQTQIPAQEYNALVALYNATDGANWTYPWTLPTDDPCGLTGVACEGGHVTELYLEGRGLNGTIPPELSQLEQLRVLALADFSFPGTLPNTLTGGFPEWVGDLDLLELLDLADLELEGTIPTTLGSLVNLVTLDLSGNALTGPIPSEFGDLSQLVTLNLAGNALTGTVPPELGNLSSLWWLYLDGNRLSGSIPPEMGDLSTLNDLYLAGNALSGPIPPELGNLTGLQRLLLDCNRLEGPIPLELSYLVQVYDLRLGYNMLWADASSPMEYLGAVSPGWDATQTVAPSGVAAEPIPGGAEVTWTPIPYTADGGYYEVGVATTAGGPYDVAAQTAQKSATGATITGLQPGTTYYLAVRTFTPAHGYQQSDLTSPFSADVACVPESTQTQIPAAEYDALVALYNATDGANWAHKWTLPTDSPCSLHGVQCAAGHVTALSLQLDGLRGTIPPELGQLDSLSLLSLNDNNLTGPIPVELAGLANLHHLWLSGNELSGTIPPEFGALANLERLHLDNNLLEGGIPAELGNLSFLQELVLAQNQLSGTIPPEIGDLPILRYLNLGGNELTGSIPPQLGSLVNPLFDLTLHLDSNHLSGPIPAEIGNLDNLVRLNLARNELEGPIPRELGNLARLEELSLDDNQLTGPIPPELGNLNSLWHLSLGSNQLTGPIPSELATAKSLWRLFLDSNELTGPIPPWLGNLPSLEYLGLSRNRLSGAIPAQLASLANLQYLSLSENQLLGAVPPEFAHLTTVWYLDIGQNMLWTDDDALHAFLDAKDPDWAATQTVPPANIVVVPSPSGAQLSWTPVAYTADGGYYEVGVATTAGGPYQVRATTADKLATGATVTGLQPGTTYYLAVRTFTPTHDLQKNDLTSPYSAEAACTLPSVTVAVTSVTVSGPTSGLVGRAYAFEARALPANASAPIAYTWAPEPASGQGTATAAYSWATAGSATISVTASNAGGAASTNHTIAIARPPASVAINGPADGGTQTNHTFSAVVTPADATPPLTYAWSPDPSSGQGSSSATYRWNAAGTHDVSVSVAGSGVTVTDSHTFLALEGTVATADPESGGSLTTEDGEGQTTTVQLPAGAVTETTTLLYAPLSPPADTPGGYQFAGRAFTLDAYRDGQRLEDLEFAAPVTVILGYTDADVDGIDESTLVLYTWDGGAWVDAVGSCSPASEYLREVDANRLSVAICHLSEFALFGTPECPEAPPSYSVSLPFVRR